MDSFRGLVSLLYQLAALVSLGLCLQAYEDELHSRLSPSLHHYVTLHPHTLTHTLHGSTSHIHHSRLVEFHVLERHFQLFLKPHYRLFSSGFKVQSVDGSGNRQQHEIDRNQYYHGYMGGEEGSVVTAHVSESGILTASIATTSETYHIEPSENFIKRPHPHHMIAYRASDVKKRAGRTKFDFVVAPPLLPEAQTETTKDRNTDQLNHKTNTLANGRDIPLNDHQTVKRQSQGNIGGSSCSMILVADYRFFREFGARSDVNMSMAGITRRLITLVSQVDTTIYRRTAWNLDPINDITRMDLGLEIAEVIIHTKSFDTTFGSGPRTYYNSDDCCNHFVPGSSTNLDANELLSAFNFGNWEGYCLAHLFTYVDFTSGLLGLANIASSFRSQTGGICSEGFTDSRQKQRIIYNTGLSSFRSGGLPLVREEQILVFAHEVGHNWGSHHDPSDNQNCVRNYLMNEFAQDGSNGSHSMFSECSRTSIGQVLNSKAGCFIDPGACGDYMVGVAPDPEECDEGPGGGACCTSDCKLKDGSVCSDTNSRCCSNCALAPVGTVCDVAGPFTRDCSTNVFCDGVQPACPDTNTTGTAPIGSDCYIGRCQATQAGSNFTKCVDFCTFQGMEPCNCTNVEDECKVCCEVDGSCRPSVENIFRPTGTMCSGGSCIGGECRAIQDTISRIFNIISNFDGNELVMFMEENIVGFTIIFSLLLWIPAAVTLHCCYDHKLWKKFKEENTDFIRALRPEKVPLLDTQPLLSNPTELHARSTSPIDDSPHPTYSSSSRGGPHSSLDSETSVTGRTTLV